MQAWIEKYKNNVEKFYTAGIGICFPGTWFRSERFIKKMANTIYCDTMPPKTQVKWSPALTTVRTADGRLQVWHELFQRKCHVFMSCRLYKLVFWRPPFVWVWVSWPIPLGVSGCKMLWGCFLWTVLSLVDLLWYAGLITLDRLSKFHFI